MYHLSQHIISYQNRARSISYHITSYQSYIYIILSYNGHAPPNSGFAGANLMLCALKTQSFIYPKVSSTKLGPDETLGAGLPDQIFSKRTHFSENERIFRRSERIYPKCLRPWTQFVSSGWLVFGLLRVGSWLDCSLAALVFGWFCSSVGWMVGFFVVWSLAGLLYLVQPPM